MNVPEPLDLLQKVAEALRNQINPKTNQRIVVLLGDIDFSESFKLNGKYDPIPTRLFEGFDVRMYAITEADPYILSFIECKVGESDCKVWLSTSRMNINIIASNNRTLFALAKKLVNVSMTNVNSNAILLHNLVFHRVLLDNPAISPLLAIEKAKALAANMIDGQYLIVPVSPIHFSHDQLADRFDDPVTGSSIFSSWLTDSRVVSLDFETATDIPLEKKVTFVGRAHYAQSALNELSFALGISKDDIRFLNGFYYLSVNFEE